MIDFSNILRAEMNKSGYTGRGGSYRLAGETGLSEATISRLLTNEGRLPSMASMAKLLIVLPELEAAIPPDRVPPQGESSRFDLKLLAAMSQAGYRGRGAAARLAKDANVSNAAVSDWKAGKCFPSTDAMRKLCRVLPDLAWAALTKEEASLHEALTLSADGDMLPRTRAAWIAWAASLGLRGGE